MSDSIPILIPARGGSKGIPGKNLKVLCGESLVAKAARTALKSKFWPVFVYSDSPDILAEAAQVGASAIERPEEVSGDKITTEATVKAFLESLDPEGKVWSAIAVMQCTTPFITHEDLNKAYDLFVSDENCDSVVTVVPFDRFLGYDGGKFDNSQYVPFRPYRTLRQEVSRYAFFMENGGLYLAKREIWLQGRRIGLHCKRVHMDWWRSIEIDEPIDLEVARRIADLFCTEVKR